MPKMKRAGTMPKRGQVGYSEVYRTYQIQLLSGGLFWIHKGGVTISHAKTLAEAKATVDMVID
jgi:hypothetical protein